MPQVTSQTKRTKDDEDAATINRWMALSSERATASSNKKSKSDNQDAQVAEDMDEDTVTSID